MSFKIPHREKKLQHMHYYKSRPNTIYKHFYCDQAFYLNRLFCLAVQKEQLCLRKNKNTFNVLMSEEVYLLLKALSAFQYPHLVRLYGACPFFWFFRRRSM